MDHGSVYRRCGCRDESTGRVLGARCPGLRPPKHGSWYFSVDLPSAAGQRRRLRRGGFATRAAAVAVLETLASPAVSLVPYLGGIPLAQLTVGDVQAMFTAIVRDESALGRPVSAATLHRIHAALRAALNGAVRSGLITVNPGRSRSCLGPPGRGRRCGLRR